MTQEEINLLLTDLCSRLPYGVKIRVEYPFLEEKDWQPETLYGLDLQRFCIAGTSIRIEEFKPYLFPLSSMTEEQKKEYCSLVWFNGLSRGWNSDDAIILDEVPMLTYFYHKNHIDYRGLIEKGLAIDATKLNIY